MAKRKPAKSESKRSQEAASKPSESSSIRLDESLVERVRDYCRSHAQKMVVVGAYFDELYATDVLDLRRRVSLGISPPQDLEFVTTVNGAAAASRKIQVRPEPDSWVAKQEWSVDTSSARHHGMRLRAALLDYEDRIVPTLETPRFISDNALCALYMTWLLVDEGVPQLLPYTSSCQALPWDGEHGRAALSAEWFTSDRIEKWERVLGRSLKLVGGETPVERSGSVAVEFKQEATAGDVMLLQPSTASDPDAEAMTFAVTAAVRLGAEELRQFNPNNLSLGVVGGRYLQLVAATGMAVAIARTGEVGFLDQAAWTRIHTQMRLAIEFALRCVAGLEIRLHASRLVPESMQIAKRAGEIVADLKQLDLQQSGPVPGEQRRGTTWIPQIRSLADELAVIGRAIAHVSPAAELEGWREARVPRHYDKPLSETALLTAGVLCQQPPDRGLSAGQIVQAVFSMFGVTVDETTVKRAITGQLKPWGVAHQKGVGYHVPVSRRLELWVRIRPTLVAEYGPRTPDS